ncbi:hypothetical protein ZWY2020_058329 [Hordeum vulgare]|nr:hypothetical protein ZWY2020_058329 [Hordeum vulgare]
MNCKTCPLNKLKLEPLEIKDVLRCILYTIFFHRTLTLVRPKDVDCNSGWMRREVQCGLAELEKEVDEKINQFNAWWFINLHVTSPKGQSKSRGSKALARQALEKTSSRRDALSLLIQEVLFQINNYAGEKKDHISPTSNRIFNHEILVPSFSDFVFGWNANLLRRALSSGHSYSLK